MTDGDFKAYIVALLLAIVVLLFGILIVLGHLSSVTANTN